MVRVPLWLPHIHGGMMRYCLICVFLTAILGANYSWATDSSAEDFHHSPATSSVATDSDMENLNKKPLNGSFSEETESLLEEERGVVSLRRALGESLNFYWPYIFSQAAVTANGVWNGYLYGDLGGAALQAEAVTLTYEFLIMGTWMGALRATSILAGQLNHNNESTLNGTFFNQRSALGNLNKVSTVLTCMYGAGAMAMFWQAGNVIGGIGLVKEAAQITQIDNYFWGFMWGTIPTLLLFNDEQFSLGVRDSKGPGFFGTLYAASASLMAYPLSRGKWGAPNWGAMGIGASMSVGATGAWLLMRGYYQLSCCGPYQGMKLYSFGSMRAAAFKQYLAYAVPLGLTNSVGLVTSFFASQFITGFSTNAATAYSAASAYFTQMEIVLLGFSSAISAQIANYDPRRLVAGSINQPQSGVYQRNLKRYALISVGSSVGLSVILTAPAMIWPDAFVNFFAGSQTTEVEALTKRYLWMVAAQNLMNTYSNAVEGVLHGLKDIAVPFLIDVCSDASTLGSVALVAKYAQDPMWLAGAGTTVAGVTAILYTARGLWEFKIVAQQVNGVVTTVSNRIARCWHRFSSWLADDEVLEEAFQ